MPDVEPLPHLLSIEQLACHLGVTPRHIRRLVAERRIPFLKVGRFVRFDPSDVGTWLDVTRRQRALVWRIVSPVEAVTPGRYLQGLTSAVQKGRRSP